MRYSVDATGVADVMSDVAAHLDDVIEAVAQTLIAVDDAIASLRPDASDVRKVLVSVFSTRRRSGPGMASYAGDVARRVQDATLAYIAGDDEMAVQTDAVAKSTAETSYRRGSGSVVF